MEQNYNSYYFIKPKEWNDEISLIADHLINNESYRPVLIIIGGPTGVGKSSLSIKLCELLGIRNYICTDTIRSIIANQDTTSVMNYFSHDCWKKFGKFSRRNLLSAFYEQSEIMCNQVKILSEDAFRHKKNTIIEGIHLLPSILKKSLVEYTDLKIINFVITTEFDFFTKTLLHNRVISTYRHRSYENYKNRLTIFKYYFELWKSELSINEGIYHLNNINRPDDLLKSALDILISDINSNT
jgi:2-phosphoglycerate kinase